MSEDYRVKLQAQLSNSLLPPQKVYYSNLYGYIESEIKKLDDILEIGAGAGISKNFLNKTNIVRTDYLNWDTQTDVLGNINAENLPYKDNQFDVVFGIDMIHHVNNPYKVLEECIRVSKKNGKIILVEPYVSMFSYIIYKIFHDEDTTYSYNFRKTYDLNNPQEGDQGVAKSMFKNKKGAIFLKEKEKQIKEITINLIHPLSFFSTGGLSKPLKINASIVSALLKIEKLIPNQIMKICASRMVVTIEIVK
jgi:ubiquinone/menaquinone biosynthesis C-methylase UbiE